MYEHSRDLASKNKITFHIMIKQLPLLKSKDIDFLQDIEKKLFI